MGSKPDKAGVPGGTKTPNRGDPGKQVIVTASQMEILRHAIGMKRSNYRRKLSWWLDNENHRNNYCVSVSWIDLNILQLVIAGLLQQGSIINGGRDVYFHVTAAGIKLAKKEFNRGPTQ